MRQPLLALPDANQSLKAVHRNRFQHLLSPNILGKHFVPAFSAAVVQRSRNYGCLVAAADCGQVHSLVFGAVVGSVVFERVQAGLELFGREVERFVALGPLECGLLGKLFAVLVRLFAWTWVLRHGCD